jgi:MFS family permease
MTFFLSTIQDHLGRKSLVLLCYVLAFLGWVLIYFFDSVYLKLLGLICFWNFMEVLSIAMVVLSNELLVNPLRNYSVNFYSIFLCVTGILGNFLTYYITTYESLLTLFFGIYMIGFFMVLFFVPQSPSFYLKSFQIKKLEGVIKNIGQTNRLSVNEINSALNNLDSVIKCIIVFNLIKTLFNKIR